MVLKQYESKLPDSYHGAPTNDAALKVIEVLKASVIQKQWELVLSSIKMGEFEVLLGSNIILKHYLDRTVNLSS